jgi:ketohexokinase
LAHWICGSTIGAGDTFIAGILFVQAMSTNPCSLDTANKGLPFAAELAGRKVLQEGFSGLGQAMSQCIAESIGI